MMLIMKWKVNCSIVYAGINQELQTEEAGPDRNTANHRIKKAQVSGRVGIK